MYRNKKVGFWLVVIGTTLTLLSGVSVLNSYLFLIIGGFVMLIAAIFGYWSSIPYIHYFEINDWTLDQNSKLYVLKVPFIKHQKYHPAVNTYENNGGIFERVGVNFVNYTIKKEIELSSTQKFGGKAVIK